MALTRAEENLQFWLGMVGLEPDFPALSPPSDEEFLPSIVLDTEQLRLIRSNLNSQQLNQILVDEGWGATTLFQYLVRDAQDRAMELFALPIAVDLSNDFLDVVITPEGLTNEIKRQMIGGILGNPWEGLNPDQYYECINWDPSTSLHEYRSSEVNFLYYNEDKPRPMRELEQHYPWLRLKFSDQVQCLLEAFRIQTALYVHVPPNTSEQRINDLVASIKWIVRGIPDVGYAAWREIYVCPRTSEKQLNRDFKRPFNFIDYPRYTHAQVYKMLIQRYQPVLAGVSRHQPLNLNEVFSQEFVEVAWNGADSLVDVSRRVRDAMLRRLDCQRSAVTFVLDPRMPEEAAPVDAAPTTAKAGLTFAERKAAAAARRADR